MFRGFRPAADRITERTEGSDHTERGFSDLRGFSGLGGSAGVEIGTLVYEVYGLTGEEIAVEDEQETIGKSLT